MPKLSVIIPVFNTVQYLKQCVESVLSQSFTDFELILVDNHSTDGSTEILREYEAKDPRVRLFTTSGHGKATQTRQFGLEQAVGEFITYVDSDDSIKPGMYEHLIREQKKDDADIVVCNYDMVYPDKVTHSYSDMIYEMIDIPKVGYSHYFLKYFCMPRPNNYLWSRIIRRSISEEHGIEFQPVDISEDTIFSMFCTAFAKRVIHVSESYYNYYQRDDSSMRVTIRSRNIADSYVQAFNCVEKYVNSHGLSDVFNEIMPVYAATRIRSILFYIGLVGKTEEEAYNSLAIALNESEMPAYLRRAVSENLIHEPELKDTVSLALKVLEKKK